MSSVGGFQSPEAMFSGLNAAASDPVGFVKKLRSSDLGVQRIYGELVGHIYNDSIQQPTIPAPYETLSPATFRAYSDNLNLVDSGKNMLPADAKIADPMYAPALLKMLASLDLKPYYAVVTRQAAPPPATKTDYELLAATITAQPQHGLRRVVSMPATTISPIVKRALEATLDSAENIAADLIKLARSSPEGCASFIKEMERRLEMSTKPKERAGIYAVAVSVARKVAEQAEQKGPPSSSLEQLKEWAWAAPGKLL